MENYRQRLEQIKESLKADADILEQQVIDKELELDSLKDLKSKVYKELRYVEKKLEKLKV